MSKQRKKRSQPTPEQLAELQQLRLRLDANDHRRAEELKQKVQEATQLALKFGVNERCELAEEFENKAAALRNFLPLPIKIVQTISLEIRPNVKKALLAFHDHHSLENKDQDEKLSDGARWILEQALCDIETISRRTCSFARYRVAEDMEDTNFTEQRIGEALEKWEDKIRAMDDDD
jgi:hypothetical protein